MFIFIIYLIVGQIQQLMLYIMANQWFGNLKILQLNGKQNLIIVLLYDIIWSVETSQNINSFNTQNIYSIKNIFAIIFWG